MSSDESPEDLRPARRYAHLEHPGTARFLELFEDDGRLHLRLGDAGRPCLELRTAFTTPGRSAQAFDRLVAQARLRGQVERTPTTPVVAGSVAHQLVTDEIVEHPDYDEVFELGPAAEWRGERRRLLHFRDGLAFDGDLDLEVLGDVHAQAWICRDHDMWARSLHVRASELGHLRDDIFGPEGELRTERLWECIATGVSPIREDRAPAPLPAEAVPPGAVGDAQVETYAAADPAMQRLVDQMARPSGVGRLLSRLADEPPERSALRRHSHLLLFNALVKNRDHPGRDVPLVERLLELGVDPTLCDAAGNDTLGEELLAGQPDVVELLARRWPGWRVRGAAALAPSPGAAPPGSRVW